MKKELKKTLIITSIITALPILIGVVLWNRLPDTIATHFDNAGDPNGWSSKWFTVFGLPMILVILNVVCTLITETDPRRHKYPEKMLKMMYWVCPVISWIAAISIYANALGYQLTSMGQWMSILLGAVFVVIGNYMPKVKQNYYLGIKLPWTYADEENWNKTHRLGGKVWVIGGILLILNAFLRIRGAEIVVIFAMILIPTIYSFFYSLRKNKGA